MNSENKNFSVWIGIASVAIPLIVAFLLFNPYKTDTASDWVKFLPHLNAVINSATVVILSMGFYFIKQKNIKFHKACMIAAFVLGVVFLISYIIYHYAVPSTHFGGAGTIKYVYYFFLISHILLSIVVVPFVLFAFYFALSKKIERHKKIVKFTFPIWMYVSVSGVIVYMMISPYYT